MDHVANDGPVGSMDPETNSGHVGRMDPEAKSEPVTRIDPEAKSEPAGRVDPEASEPVGRMDPEANGEPVGFCCICFEDGPLDCESHSDFKLPSAIEQQEYPHLTLLPTPHTPALPYPTTPPRLHALPCQHTICTRCITWLSNHDNITCPKCETTTNRSDTTTNIPKTTTHAPKTTTHVLKPTTHVHKTTPSNHVPAMSACELPGLKYDAVKCTGEKLMSADAVPTKPQKSTRKNKDKTTSIDAYDLDQNLPMIFVENGSTSGKQTNYYQTSTPTLDATTTSGNDSADEANSVNDDIEVFQEHVGLKRSFSTASDGASADRIPATHVLGSDSIVSLSSLDSGLHCGICFAWADVACSGCGLLVCEECLGDHSKQSGCKEHDSQQAEEALTSKQAELRELWEELQEQATRLEEEGLKADQITEESVQQCVSALDDAEEEVLMNVREWFSTQRRGVRKLKASWDKDTRDRSRGMAGIAKQMMVHISAMQKHSSQTVSQGATLQQIFHYELAKLKKETVSPMRLKQVNEHLDAFDTDKALTYEVVTEPQRKPQQQQKRQSKKKKSSKSDSADWGVLIQFSSLKTSSLNVQTVGRLPGYVFQLLVVSDRLWALMREKIVIYSFQGSHMKTVSGVSAGFCEARDMTSCQDGHVVVATLDQGLIQLTQDGTKVRQIDTGRYWSVVSCGLQILWGLKEDVRGENIRAHLFTLTGYYCKQIMTFEVQICCGGANIYSTMAGNNLFICSEKDGMLYAIDTAKVSIKSQPVTFKITQLEGTRSVQHDGFSQCLLLTCPTSNCLKLYDVSLGAWTEVKTKGSQLHAPTACVSDENGTIWVSGASPCQLYKCTL